jgi:hypothetical protein
MNLVSLTDWQYREMESESEHQDPGLPVPKNRQKKKKRKMPVTPDSNVEGKRRKAQQGTDPKKTPNTRVQSMEFGTRGQH